jgi:3-hydroxyacyl-CoA dehydrogenase
VEETGMQQTVSVARHGPIAIITINNPPVNALSHSVRVGLLDVLPGIEADPGITAILLLCAGATFSAGADVREFGAPPRDPIMAVAMAALEASGKITVAAIHGQALGGGLETALVFDYRCALTSAKVGLPEIKLGLFPGGGGTQRLPRLAGLETAFDMIMTGEAISAAKAKKRGIVDHLIESDLHAGAIAYVERLLNDGAKPRRLNAGRVAVPEGFDFAQRRAKALKDHKGLPAAGAAADALHAATDRDFEAGLAEERRLFMLVRSSVEAAAMRHLFMGEREVGRIPGLPPDTSPRPVNTVAVIGAGTMGGGIAISLANAGLAVTLVDAADTALARGVGNINSIFANQVERGRISVEEAKTRLARITPTLKIEDAAEADLIIECVFEDMAVKQTLFARLGAIAKPGAVLATNTSALDVNKIAAASGRAVDTIGLHFFSPANVMRLVEVIRGAETAPDVLATAMALCKRIGKIGVVAGVCDGFIGNRMLRGYRREAEFLVLEGAAPQAVDKVLTTFGMAMGVHAMGDMAGLDVSAAGRKRQRAEGVLDDPKVGVVQDKLVELGRLGLKSAKGIYRYETGSRIPLPDPEVIELIAAAATQLGVLQREITADEILLRCMLPLVNEGAKILDEGIALGAVDIDVIYCTGYGFPRHRGGPMFWADQFGLGKVVEKINLFGESLGPKYWTPAPLLVRLAGEGGSFGTLPRGVQN